MFELSMHFMVSLSRVSKQLYLSFEGLSGKQMRCTITVKEARRLAQELTLFADQLEPNDQSIEDIVHNLKEAADRLNKARGNV